MAAGKRLSLEELVSFAYKRGGVVLSKKYESAHKKIKWKCKLGHVFFSNYANVKYHGSWCRKCGVQRSSQKRKHKIKHVKNLLKNKGFLLVSKTYKNNSSPIIAKCSNDHQIKTTLYRIKKGDRCYLCKISSENITRSIFEFYTGKKFPRERPIWLKHNNKRLELDGYCKSLNMAFEYQGLQHYREITFFHSKQRSFNKQKNIDKIKRKKCKINGVKLFVVGPFKKSNLFNDANSKIRHILQITHKKNPNIAEIYKNVKENKLLELHEIARKNNGIYLLDYAPSASEKGAWECSKGHIFNTIISHARRGVWCQKCHFDKLRLKKKSSETL